MDDDTRDISATDSGAGFATTRWSVVLRAGQSGSPGYREALETLCRSYWFPLYAYLRRRGYDCHQAEDYTQGFFAGLLERQVLGRADPARGKFRSFLLASLKNFVADQCDRSRARKRGGTAKTLSLDVKEAETRYALEATETFSPEKMFERSWALTVLQQAMTRLKAECAEAGKTRLFDKLKCYLQGDDRLPSHSEIAADLGMSGGSVRVAVHRLRQRYRDLVRQEIAQTVAEPDQVDEEIRDLFEALTR